jgi:glucose-6-phosphate isomerase
MAETSKSWKQLTRAATECIDTPLSDWLAQPARFENFSHQAAGLLVDLSKQRIDSNIKSKLLNLAESRALPQRIEDLFTGAAVNSTQHRPALHTALRAAPEDRPEIAAVVAPVQARLNDLVSRVRDGHWLGYSGKALTDVVHIGIGGSHLGPELALLALASQSRSAPRVHFVANIDRAALDAVLRGLNPERSLFIIASKSFSTLETQVNAASARSWFLERVGHLDAIGKHFIAISSNTAAAAEFGIKPANTFELWDWVGGRFSLWSAVGLPVMLAIGTSGFQQLLAGAAAMDKHFRHTALVDNIPVLMALTGIWNYNFLGVTNHAILPYSERLRVLPEYLQQLEMESNGKSISNSGKPVSNHTMPILWGGRGTNGQHAFHQLLHQGSRSFTADFILTNGGEDAPAQIADHQRWLLANALGQSQAMAQGQHDPDPHKTVVGGHATTTIVLPELSPFSLGALLALYEHKVFCQGVIWDINSFDQWGVELGKRLAIPIFEQLAGKSPLLQDASTQGLIKHLRQTKTADEDR